MRVLSLNFCKSRSVNIKFILVKSGDPSGVYRKVLQEMKFKHLKTQACQELRHFKIREVLQLHGFQKIKALYPPKIVTLKLSPVSEAHKFETYPFPELRHPKSWEFLQLRSSQTKAIQRVENSSLLNVETQNSRVFSNFGDWNSDLFLPERWNTLQVKIFSNEELLQS